MLALTGKLLRWDQVPPIFREIGIERGYRNPRSSAWQCIHSLILPTNETLNIWTHLLPALFFLFRFAVTFTSEYDLSDPHLWPLAVLLASSIIFPLGSAAAHAFNTMSERARHGCFFVDYACIALFSFASAVAYSGYSFRETALAGGLFHDVFVPIVFCMCLGCVTTSCRTRFMKQSPLRVVLRTVPFAVLYCFSAVPAWYRLFATGELWTEPMQWHLAGNAWAFASLVVYALHFPERFCPGRFDIYGHSHQLFHVFAILSTRAHINGFIADMVACEPKAALAEGRHPFAFRSVSPITLACLLCVLFSVIIVCFWRCLPVVKSKAARFARIGMCRTEGAKRNGSQNGHLKNGHNKNGPSRKGL